MISKETFDLAGRHEADLAALDKALRAQSEAEKAEEARRKAFDRDRAVLHRKIAEARNAVQTSGAAQRACENEVPRELRLALDDAELQVRLLETRATESAYRAKVMQARNVQLAERGAHEEALTAAAQDLQKARDEAKELAEELRKAKERAKAARANVRSTLEAMRKAAKPK